MNVTRMMINQNQKEDESIALRDQIDKEKLPRHIAIIMDGNGRWANQRGKQRISGHKEGVNAVKAVVEGCGEAGVNFLSLYVFSKENWKRPKGETDALMSLLSSTIKSEIDNLKKNNVRLLTIGDITSLPNSISKQIEKAVSETSQNTGLGKYNKKRLAGKNPIHGNRKKRKKKPK